MRPKRAWLAIVLGLLAVWCVLFVIVRAHNRILRTQAESLYAEFLRLQPGKTTRSDVEAMRKRWGHSLVEAVDCEKNKCEYRFSCSFWNDSRWWEMLELIAHGHSAVFFATLKTVDNTLLSASFTLETVVPIGYGTREEGSHPQRPGYVAYSSGEYLLQGRAFLATTLPEVTEQLFPDYRFWGPAGCEGCLAIWASALPSLSPARRAEVLQMNFNCIDQWKVCTDKEDIMPTAGRELARLNVLRENAAASPTAP